MTAGVEDGHDRNQASFVINSINDKIRKRFHQSLPITSF